jgi:hypothetical protein
VGNTFIQTNESLFNLLLSRYAVGNEASFGGYKVLPALNLEFVYGIQGPPVVTFSDSLGTNAISFLFNQMELRLYDYENGQRGGLKDTYSVPITVLGTLSLSGTALTVSGLTAVPAAEGKLDAKVAKMFNDTVVPQFQKQVASIPLPDLSTTIGLPVELLEIQVQRDSLLITAQAGSSGGIPCMPAVTSSDAVIAITIASDVIHDLALSKFNGVSVQAGDRSSHSGFGYEGHAAASAKPDVRISGGVGSGTLKVSANARGGLEVFGKWVEQDISISAHTPALNLCLLTDNSGKKAFVKAYLDGNISFDYGLPNILETAADEILSVIKPLARNLTDAVNVELNQRQIDLFTLPDKLPGTNLSADLTFQELGFVENSAIAVIKLT